MQQLDQFLLARRAWQIAVLALLLLVLVAALDAAVRHEISLSILFLIPVSLAAWYGRPRFAYALCVLAALAWLVIDLRVGPRPELDWAPLWNSGVAFCVLLIVVHLLLKLRDALATQRSLARHDNLTGLYNARALKQHYEAAARLVQRGGGSIVVGFLDIDNFKLVNDTLGHRTGDRVLVSVAAALDARMRASDAIGRIGGDEFVLVLPQTDIDGARSFFGDVCKVLGEMALRNRWPISFSVGVAVFGPPLPSADDALAKADALMYSVKNSGKNAVAYKRFDCQPVLSAALADGEEVRTPVERAAPTPPPASGPSDSDDIA